MRYVSEDGIEYFIANCYKKWAELEIRLTEIYEEVEPFSTKSLRLIKRKRPTNTYGFITKHGKEIDKLFSKAWPFRNGVAIVYKEGKFTFIDESGEEIIYWFDHFVSKKRKPFTKNNLDFNTLFNHAGFSIIENNDSLGVVNIR